MRGDAAYKQDDEVILVQDVEVRLSTLHRLFDGRPPRDVSDLIKAVGLALTSEQQQMVEDWGTEIDERGDGDGSDEAVLVRCDITGVRDSDGRNSRSGEADSSGRVGATSERGN